MSERTSGSVLALVLLLGAGTDAEPYRLQDALPGLSFEQPVYLTSAGDGTQRMFIVEKPGTIRVLDPGAERVTVSTFLDLRDVVRAFRPETGLLGLAFHPEYETNGRFFVHYSGASFRSFLSEFLVSSDPDSAIRESERVLLDLRQPSDMHNGGQLEFGPGGYLYVGFGDGIGPDDRFGNGQNRATLLGTILRLDVDAGDPYGIPPDNPFVGNVQGWREEIWAWGLRNPWRFSFDPHTGELWAGDVGEAEREEVNVIEKGRNYGWNRMEGTLCRDAAGCDDGELTPPVFEYDHTEGAAINGGYVYRGHRQPALQGVYLFGDFGSRKVWGLRREQDGDGTGVRVDLLALAPAQITSFGRDALGEIYVLTIAGEVQRLERSPPTVFPPERLSETGIFADLPTQEPSPGVLPYEVNVPLWSDGAGKQRYLNLPPRSGIVYRESDAWSMPRGSQLIKSFYLPGEDRIVETRLLIRRDDGQGWDGYTYRWNEEETEAILIDGSLSQTYTVDTPAGEAQHTHYFPSRQECGQCHTRAAGYVLGIRTGQLNRNGQIQAWRQAGVLIAGVPEVAASARLPPPDDRGVSRTRRARAYLDVNCAHCHRPGHFTRAVLDLRYDTNLADTGLLQPPALGGFDVPRARLLTPGDPAGSILYHRILDTGTRRMPPLASALVDTQAAALVAGWIEELLRRATVIGQEERSSSDDVGLHLPFPNPTNGQVTISFELATEGHVRLELYNVAGQRIEVLLAAQRSAGGKHRVHWNTGQHASGMYFLRLLSGGEWSTRRLALVR